MFPSRRCSQAAALPVISVSHLYWQPHTCFYFFTTEFLFPKTITLLVEKVDLSTSCLKLFVYQKMGFAQPVPVPQQRTELIFLSQKGCIQACMAL